MQAQIGTEHKTGKIKTKSFFCQIFCFDKETLRTKCLQNKSQIIYNKKVGSACGRESG